ncbi:uncharacterized protein HKW66_Vig0040230 [Vigna angularis]|uniref:Uncharacterized protein n=1 Tax=Phaseolus angularis TaxID=3914 RepID=A0A8T0LCG0_PHAAN|nr:uncharacterized protein HKW66_Vig0040230 [Vigna angularis]
MCEGIEIIFTSTDNEIVNCLNLNMLFDSFVELQSRVLEAMVPKSGSAMPLKRLLLDALRVGSNPNFDLGKIEFPSPRLSTPLCVVGVAVQEIVSMNGFGNEKVYLVVHEMVRKGKKKRK